ncbi:MAG TPA: hypothetical protein VLB44_27730, partial [Kofleriaceae bacterium]|nr:hypothetical protein [Kofleriaceae bacterium]
MMGRSGALLSGLLLAALATLAGCPTSVDPDLGGGSGSNCDPQQDSSCPPVTTTCDTFTTAGDFQLCAKADEASYMVVVKYTGSGKLALGSSDIRLQSKPYDATSSFDAATQTFTLHAQGLAPTKYSFLFRLQTDSGAQLRPLFVPLWVGKGV